MYTAKLHFENHLGEDTLRISADTLEALQEKAEQERKRRSPEAWWSSDVCKDGNRI